MTLRKYRKRPDKPVVAVRLALETSGFEYQKWGGTQRCKQGDWIVDNGGDFYTIDAETFTRTYRKIAPGQYIKHASVWVEVAKESGVVKTKEGSTEYSPDDYIVSNNEDGRDSWAMSATKFNELYEPDED